MGLIPRLLERRDLPSLHAGGKMNYKKTVLVSFVVASFLSVQPVRAQHLWEDPGAWTTGHFSYDTSKAFYSAQEVSLDLFASYINPEQKFSDLFETNIRNGF